ncbi:MAG: UDP-N-acetylglucosamine 2-epimerase (non-hydrolyzing) [Ignavibacteriaceae bacterium]|nr:UDP-N-acetylglucosamine 2-epimerase (non-hydrolyzing) [Ignavibacteriaceae bacterium]
MQKILSVVGARPNFMKIAPIHKEFTNHPEIKHLICHTGQHYDKKMSEIFFTDLELPKPDFYLGVGSGTHAEQTAGIMIKFEKVLEKENPDLIIVVGDVNSTIACSLTAAKMGIKIAHIEAGLRSFDNTMPEEINRILTDRISDYLFVSEKAGLRNLKHEGADEKKIFFVGNTMIDSLVNYLPKAENSQIFEKLKLHENYILITLHRPANVDSDIFISQLYKTLSVLSKHRKIVFPIHPRTRKNLELHSNNDEISERVIFTEPLGYIDFLALTKNAELIITDSGGIQEESTFLGVQCITVRDNTERPSTVEIGTNQLIGTNMEKVESAAIEVLGGKKKTGSIPELWDGSTAKRIVKILTN